MRSCHPGGWCWGACGEPTGSSGGQETPTDTWPEICEQALGKVPFSLRWSGLLRRNVSAGRLACAVWSKECVPLHRDLRTSCKVSWIQVETRGVSVPLFAVRPFYRTLMLLQGDTCSGEMVAWPGTPVLSFLWWRQSGPSGSGNMPPPRGNSATWCPPMRVFAQWTEVPLEPTPARGVPGLWGWYGTGSVFSAGAEVE